MRAYHGTPGGGTRQDQTKWLPGRDALVPYPRQDDLGVVAAVCKSFIFDNGAYSTWKRGEPMDVEGFTRWVEQWRKHPGFEWALIPDVIDGTEADNDAMLRDWPAHLHAVGVPVWHMHESFERLARLCSEYRTVALGSSGQWRSPGTLKWWQRMAGAMDAICDDAGRPAARLHGLRMLDPEIFTRLPLASADSTNAAVNSGSLDRFGMYPAPTAGQRASVIADRIEAYTSAPTWKAQAIQVEFLLEHA